MAAWPLRRGEAPNQQKDALLKQPKCRFEPKFVKKTEHLLPDYPDGLFVARSDPDGSGGRHLEFYHLNQLLESVELNPGERRKACQPRDDCQTKTNCGAAGGGPCGGRGRAALSRRRT